MGAGFYEIMLISTQVEVVVEVGVELGNIVYNLRFFLHENINKPTLVAALTIVKTTPSMFMLIN